MIVFLLLGFAAGVLNVMRAAGVVPSKLGSARVEAMKKTAPDDSAAAQRGPIGHGSHPPVRDQEPLSDHPHRRDEIAFTNSALFMLIALSLILLLMLGATASRALVPGRLQSVAEMSYEFVANTLRSTAGAEGMRFFPLVFSLFMFILC